jgi:hypothetical protein
MHELLEAGLVVGQSVGDERPEGARVEGGEGFVTEGTEWDDSGGERGGGDQGAKVVGGDERQIDGKDQNVGMTGGGENGGETGERASVGSGV